MSIFNNVKSLSFPETAGVFTKSSMVADSALGDIASLSYGGAAMYGAGIGGTIGAYNGTQDGSGLVSGAIGGAVKGAVVGGSSKFASELYATGGKMRLDNGKYVADNNRFKFGNFTKGWVDSGPTGV